MKEAKNKVKKRVRKEINKYKELRRYIAEDIKRKKNRKEKLEW